MAVAKKFRFKLGQQVRINASSEHGEVIGRAEYQHCEPHYLLRYVASDKRAVENWWTDAALSARGGM